MPIVQTQFPLGNPNRNWWPWLIIGAIVITGGYFVFRKPKQMRAISKPPVEGQIEEDLAKTEDSPKNDKPASISEGQQSVPVPEEKSNEEIKV
jgi:hypothetical protein